MKHFHRAHVTPLGLDSNPAQFERQGNPWDGDGRFTRKARKGRKRRDFDGQVRRPERSSREESENFIDLRANAKLWQAMRAKRSNSRTVAPEKSPHVAKIVPAARAELRPLTSRERWLSFEQRAKFRVTQALAERAWAASEAGKAAERRRLEQILAATEAKLAKLG
jgi:hypothetical protein